MSDLIDCNAIGKRAQQTPDLGLVINRGVFDFSNYAVVTFGGAAFATSDNVKSQCGDITVLCKPEHVTQVCKGRYDLCVPVSWRSATIKRVVRSTLAAEGYAVSEATEQTEWLKQVLEEVQQPPGVRLGVVEKVRSDPEGRGVHGIRITH